MLALLKLLASTSISLAGMILAPVGNHGNRSRAHLPVIADGSCCASEIFSDALLDFCQNSVSQLPYMIGGLQRIKFIRRTKMSTNVGNASNRIAGNASNRTTRVYSVYLYTFCMEPSLADPNNRAAVFRSWAASSQSGATDSRSSGNKFAWGQAKESMMHGLLLLDYIYGTSYTTLWINPGQLSCMPGGGG